MAVQSPVSYDTPLSSPFTLPRNRNDDGGFLKCRNCATKIWALDCDGKDLCRLCMNLKIYVSRHYDYATK